MGVYNPKIKMPTSCVDCKVGRVFPDCRRYKAVIDDISSRRAGDCPLIEVKTPHGRLIDADALMQSSGVTIIIKHKDDAIAMTEALDSIYQDIEDAQTVIKAEVE